MIELFGQLLNELKMGSYQILNPHKLEENINWMRENAISII